MDSYLEFGQHYYVLEHFINDLNVKLDTYKIKTSHKLDYSELENKIKMMQEAQTYLRRLWENNQIDVKRNFDLERILLEKTARIKELEKENNNLKENIR